MSEVVVILELDINAQALDAVIGGFPTMLEETAARPGFLEVKVVRQPGGTKVLLIERWEDLQSHSDYIAWRTERGDMDAMGQALNSPPKLDIYEETIVSK